MGNTSHKVILAKSYEYNGYVYSIYIDSSKAGYWFHLPGLKSSHNYETKLLAVKAVKELIDGYGK